MLASVPDSETAARGSGDRPACMNACASSDFPACVCDLLSYKRGASSSDILSCYALLALSGLCVMPFSTNLQAYRDLQGFQKAGLQSKRATASLKTIFQLLKVILAQEPG